VKNKIRILNVIIKICNIISRLSLQIAKDKQPGFKETNIITFSRKFAMRQVNVLKRKSSGEELLKRGGYFFGLF